MMILAPLRGVTIHAFRRVFARAIIEAGFTEAFTPFITANSGYDPIKDRELKSIVDEPIRLTPQFIGKDPKAFSESLRRIRAIGFTTADLNCGCPFPMVRNKGRGCGILRTPDVLRRMIDVGCEIMGEGNFSIKTRLGIDRNDELLSLIPLLNMYPLRFITVHARTAVQMYDGECDLEALAAVENNSVNSIVRNGELDWRGGAGMVGRSFIRDLGKREDINELLDEYINYSIAELGSGSPVTGRIKELLTYWITHPRWAHIWRSAKFARSIDELKIALK